jgi:transposase InsO family protein
VPAQVVTDNGPQYTSAEFQLFLKTNRIKHITTASFQPATNGQAERFVQSFKHAMKCEKQSTSQLKTSMAKFLLALPEYTAFDDWRITVRVVWGQTATDSPRFGET